MLAGPQPGQEEWVELFNAGDVAVSTADWSIRRVSASGTTQHKALTTVTIEPGMLALFTFKSGFLPNDGATLHLLNAQEQPVGDAITYPDLENDQTYARIHDGDATWSEHTPPSPGAPNVPPVAEAEDDDTQAPSEHLDAQTTSPMAATVDTIGVAVPSTQATGVDMPATLAQAAMTAPTTTTTVLTQTQSTLSQTHTMSSMRQPPVHLHTGAAPVEMVAYEGKVGNVYTYHYLPTATPTPQPLDGLGQDAGATDSMDGTNVANNVGASAKPGLLLNILFIVSGITLFLTGTIWMGLQWKKVHVQQQDTGTSVEYQFPDENDVAVGENNLAGDREQ